MNLLLLFSCLLVSLFGVITASSTSSNLPQCALTCVATPFAGCGTPETNQTCICVKSGLQANFEACVVANCTVKDWLITNNVTASACDWPHRDRSSLLKSIPIALFSVTTVSIFLRMIAKTIGSQRQIGYDDFVMIIAWLLLAGITTLVWLLSNSGLGQDQWTVSSNNITLTLMLFDFLIVNYSAAVWLTKLSILFLYLRLFPDQRFRLVVKTGIFFCSIACITFTVMALLQCSPISFSWTFWDHEHAGRCVNIPALAWSHTCINITADVLVLFLPLPTIWKLNLPLKKRIGVMAMLSLGLFVTSVSIVRATLLSFQALGANQTWNLFLPALWSSIETCMTMICACMPGMRAFYTRFIRDWALKRIRHDQEHQEGIDPSSSTKTLRSSKSGVESKRKDDTPRLTLMEAETTMRGATVES